MLDPGHKKILCSWSGGKDSCFALMQAVKQGCQPAVLLNVLNETGLRSRSHGISPALLEQQAEATGIPLHTISSSWQAYETQFITALQSLKEQYKLSHAVFGDIDLQPHRDWEEKVCAAAELQPLLPLWQQSRRTLVLEMIAGGVEAMIVSCNEKMGESYLGRLLSPSLITELEMMGIDACGENGEYHTFVRNCPLFSNAVPVHVTGKQQHNGYWFADLSL